MFSRVRMVQLAAPGSPFPDSTWEMGASLVSRGEVRADTSSQLSVGPPGVPVVMETEMSFRPGPFELVMVAHDTKTDQVSSTKLEGEWPDPIE